MTSDDRARAQLCDEIARGTAPTDTPRDVVVVDNVVRHFGGVRAVDGVSLGIRSGAITGIIGPNGAGKSTLVGVVSGAIQHTSGAIYLDGVDISRKTTYQRVRSGLVRTYQIAHEFGRLTAVENLIVGAQRQRGESALGVLLGKRYWRAEEEAIIDRAFSLLRLFNMENKASELAGQLSGGQKRMVEIMRALMTQPKVLILDEPMAGLSPMMTELLEGICVELRSRGVTMVLIEHELGSVDRLCDNVFVMVQGKVLAEGAMRDLRADRRVQDAYLVG